MSSLYFKTLYFEMYLTLISESNWILSCFSILFFIHDLMSLPMSSRKKTFPSLHKDLTCNSNLTFVTQSRSQLLIPVTKPPSSVPTPPVTVSFMWVISLVLVKIFMDCRGKTNLTADFSLPLYPCHLIMYQVPQYNPRFYGYCARSLSIQKCYRRKYYGMKMHFSDL